MSEHSNLIGNEDETYADEHLERAIYIKRLEAGKEDL